MEKKLTKKNKIDKILKLIFKMENNTFLLPDSWSELVLMTTRSANYKTYVGGRGYNRYINIEYVKNDELYNPKQEDCYSITIRKNAIYLNKRLGENKNEVDIVLDIVESIYKEKYSFEIMDNKVVENRRLLRELKETISATTKKFNKIKRELDDKKLI